MPTGVAVDWTFILVHLIYGLPAILATVFAYLIRRDLKTPSGATAGSVLERTHNAAVTAANTAIAVHQGEPPTPDEGALVPPPLLPNNG